MKKRKTVVVKSRRKLPVRKRSLGKVAKRKPIKRVVKARKPKFKVGDFVYSPENRTEKRQVNDVRVPKSPLSPIKYRLTMCDCKGRPKNSKLFLESSLRKTKKS